MHQAQTQASDRREEGEGAKQEGACSCPILCFVVGTAASCIRQCVQHPHLVIKEAIACLHWMQGDAHGWAACS